MADEPPPDEVKIRPSLLYDPVTGKSVNSPLQEMFMARPHMTPAFEDKTIIPDLKYEDNEDLFSKTLHFKKHHQGNNDKKSTELNYEDYETGDIEPDMYKRILENLDRIPNIGETADTMEQLWLRETIYRMLEESGEDQKYYDAEGYEYSLRGPRHTWKLEPWAFKYLTTKKPAVVRTDDNTSRGKWAARQKERAKQTQKGTTFSNKCEQDLSEGDGVSRRNVHTIHFGCQKEFKCTPKDEWERLVKNCKDWYLRKQTEKDNVTPPKHEEAFSLEKLKANISKESTPEATSNIVQSQQDDANIMTTASPQHVIDYQKETEQVLYNDSDYMGVNNNSTQQFVYDYTEEKGTTERLDNNRDLTIFEPHEVHMDDLLSNFENRIKQYATKSPNPSNGHHVSFDHYSDNGNGFDDDDDKNNYSSGSKNTINVEDNSNCSPSTQTNEVPTLQLESNNKNNKLSVQEDPVSITSLTPTLNNSNTPQNSITERLSGKYYPTKQFKIENLHIGNVRWFTWLLHDEQLVRKAAINERHKNIRYKTNIWDKMTYFKYPTFNNENRGNTESTSLRMNMEDREETGSAYPRIGIQSRKYTAFVSSSINKKNREGTGPISPHFDIDKTKYTIPKTLGSNNENRRDTYSHFDLKTRIHPVCTSSRLNIENGKGPVLINPPVDLENKNNTVPTFLRVQMENKDKETLSTRLNLQKEKDTKPILVHINKVNRNYTGLTPTRFEMDNGKDIEPVSLDYDNTNQKDTGPISPHVDKDNMTNIRPISTGFNKENRTYTGSQLLHFHMDKERSTLSTSPSLDMKKTPTFFNKYIANKV